MADGRNNGRKVGILGFDYPKPNERITGSEYSFRIWTNTAGAPEISIDDGPWQSCRPAEGYWWFDWRCEPGLHRAVVRLQIEAGPVLSRPRGFRVGLPARKGSTTKRKAPAPRADPSAR